MSRSRRLRGMQFLGVSTAALAFAIPAVGQEGDDQQARLGTVTVTAERRAETAQSVPVAVTALDSEALQSRQIVDVQSLKSVVPNVVIEDVPGGSSSIKLFLRGVGTDNPVFSGDGAVGVYIDDVFIARAIGANFDLYDIDRVEVLRGPQGTLYGRNSSAGALKIQTADPVLDEDVMKAEFGVGNNGQIEAKAAVNAPLVDDKLAARLSVFSSSHDPLQTNLVDGSEAYDKNIHGGRAKLLWAAAPTVDVLLSADFVRERALPNVAVSFRDEDLDFDGEPEYRFDGDLLTYESALSDIFQDIDNFGLSAKVNWALSDTVELTSITAYRDLFFQIRDDVDGTVASRFEPNQRLDNSTFSQEFNLSGGTDRFDWVTGLYYFEEESDFLWDLTVFANLGAPQNFQFFNQKTEAYALFGQATFDLTDRLSLTGGLRYTEETKDFSAEGYIETGPQPVRGGDPVGTLDWTFADDITFDNVSYRLAADFALTDQALVYASYSTGYRSGGFNGGARSLAEVSAPPFAEETVDTAEIGLKSDWADGRLRFNATYFVSDFQDLQEASLRAGGFATETSDAEINGVEIEAQALVTDGFVLGLQAGTLDGEVDGTGQEVKYTPDLTYTLTADWTQPLANGGELFASASYAYEDEYFINVENQPEVAVPEHEIVDARIGYRLPGGRWEIELAARNLFDEAYPTHGFFINLPAPPAGPGPLSTISFPNKPQMVIARVRLNM